MLQRGKTILATGREQQKAALDKVATDKNGKELETHKDSANDLNVIDPVPNKPHSRSQGGLV